MRALGVVMSLDARLAGLGVADLARHVVPVDDLLLDEHVQTLLVLGQRVPGDLVYKRLEPLAPRLNKIALVNAIVGAEGKLHLEGLPGKRWHHDLAIPLQLVPQPLEVAVAAANTGLLHLKHGQVGPHAHFVVGVALVADAVCDGAGHVDLEEVCGGGVRVVERLLLRHEAASGVLSNLRHGGVWWGLTDTLT